MIGSCRPHERSFNPRPPLLAGDSSRRTPLRLCCACFNPRPPLLAGDATQPRVASAYTRVSIHARHYWRAMRAQAGGKIKEWSVSIHARHYWRAMRSCAGLLLRTIPVSIHARHYWRAMRRSTAPSTSAQPFQSTPAITGGRCLSAAAHRPWAGCFNPRPPLLAGDARTCAPHPSSSGCFNPRPPLLAGDAHQLGGGGAPVVVSIHARHYWRAMLLVCAPSLQL